MDGGNDHPCKMRNKQFPEKIIKPSVLSSHLAFKIFGFAVLSVAFELCARIISEYVLYVTNRAVPVGLQMG